MPKLTINAQKNSDDAKEQSCLVVKVYLDPSDITFCEDDAANLDNLDCNAIDFYVSNSGITAGNPDCTINGRIISGTNPRPTSCDE